MKQIRYGRLLFTILLFAWSLWIIFGSEARKETPYERRVRVLQTELEDMDPEDPATAEKQAELERVRAEAEATTPEKLAERAARLERELAGMEEGSEAYREKAARLANLRQMLPKWYDMFPLNLGLDLRGGTEVRLRIVSEKLSRRRDRYAAEVERLTEELQGLAPENEAYPEAREALAEAQEKLSAAETALQSNIQDAIEVVRRRLDSQGMASIQVTKEGRNRIRIELPGMDSQRARSVINTVRMAGRLEFRIVANLAKNAPVRQLLEEAEPNLEPNSYNVCLQPGHGRPLKPSEIDDNGLCKVHGVPLYDYLELPPEYDDEGNRLPGPARVLLIQQQQDPLTGRRIESARVSMDQNNPGFFVVDITFDLAGTRRFARLTTDYAPPPNVDPRNAKPEQVNRLAIVLDGRLKSAPTINEPITGGRCQISGNFTQREARELALVLKEGSLPVDLEVEMERNVGASLGEDSIAAGMQAILVGLVLVLVFMAVYYMVAGLVTDACLFLNLAFILGLFISMGAVLTLPGIAGLILTVGMAVDANVLIFERIREERQKGAGLEKALQNGYDRAFVTIVDANLTTFITALILLTFGTAAVKGFAMTLTIGIVTSMFTALFVSRGIFHVLIDLGVVKELKMNQLVGTPRVDFIRLCRAAAAGSVGLILAGLVIFGLAGGFAPQGAIWAHDFTGGVLAQPNFREPVAPAAVREKLPALRERTREKLQAALREELARQNRRGEPAALDAAAVELSPEVVGAIDIQGYGVPVAGRFPSMVLRTKSATLQREALRGGFDAGTVAALFSGAFRDAIGEVLPVVSDGITGMRRLDVTRQGRPLWEFTLTLNTPRAPQELQEILAAGSKLEDVHVRPVDAPRPVLRGSRAEVTVALSNTGPDGKPIDAAAYRPALLETLRELGPAWLELPDALGEVSATDAAAEAGQTSVTTTLALARPMTADEVEKALLQSDRIHAAAATLTDLPAPAPPPVEARQELTVLCSVPLGAVAGDTGALAQEQFIRAALGDLRAAGEVDYTESFGRFTSIGPTVAGEMKQKALLALLYSMVAIFFYIWLRFQFRAAFGIGACLALAHDVLFTIGAIAVADHLFGLNIKIDLPIVAALLTIVGYSLNDTIVVFDRIRENLQTGGKSLAETVNLSVNQTLSRTLLTSLTTLLVVLALLILGGEVIRGFAFALLIGVLVGTYSSVFIASPVLVFLETAARRRRERQAATA
jgi:SecD/SecF fusion protein